MARSKGWPDFSGWIMTHMVREEKTVGRSKKDIPAAYFA